MSMDDIAISAISRLNDLNVDDNNSANNLHEEADDILLQFLQESGNGDITLAFEKARDRIGFMYA